MLIVKGGARLLRPLQVIAGKYAGDLFCGELFFVNKKWRGGAESADKAGFVPLFEGKSKKRKAKVVLKKSKKREWYYFSRKITKRGNRKWN